MNLWLPIEVDTLVDVYSRLFIWYKAMAIGGIARVSQTQLLQPFITIIASSLLLSEHISLRTFVFAGTVVMIVAIGKRMPILSKKH